MKITKLDKSRIEIVGSIDVQEFEKFKRRALQNINEEVTIDGFRKGKVPENILVSKVGTMAILEEMAGLALSKFYPEIIIKEKIDAIGRPEISITKLAEGNPLDFKITTAVLPEIKLGDYKKIAKEENKKELPVIEITEREIEEAIKKIKESHTDHAGHNHDSPEEKEQMKKYLIDDKKMQEQEKRRIAISDKLIETSTIDIPEILIGSELHRIESQFENDIKRMGVKMEDYIKHAQKTIDEIRKEWRPHAEKKARLQLIINKISSLEKIQVEKKEVEKEVEHILEHYKNADREHAYTYAETVLINEKVYKFLEYQK